MKRARACILLALALLPLATGCQSMPASATTASSQPGDAANDCIVGDIGFRPEKLFRSAEGRVLVHEFRATRCRIPQAGDRLLLFAVCGSPRGEGPQRLARVKDLNSWPDDHRIAYVFLLDASNQVRLVQIVPNSESGDWYEQNDYLFGPDGSLHYWERYFGAFNPDGPNRAWYAYAWSQSGTIIDQAEQFTDFEGRPWGGARPEHPPRPPTRLWKLLDQHSLTEALKAARMEIGHAP